MADPISVRHVMATAGATERVTKAEAAQQQAFNDEFAREVNRQQHLKQTRVIRKDESQKMENEDRQGKREQERKHASARTKDEQQEDAVIESDHIIDVQV